MQMSAVLRHVAKYRPNWVVDYVAEEGKHQVARGIVSRHFAYGKQPQDARYDAEVQICLYDTWANWGDRPNTRVSSALHERFDLPWDPECGRYRVDVRREMETAAARIAVDYPTNSRGMVAIHYQGDSSKERKDLTHDQAYAVCKAVVDLKYTPLLLDWRNTSPLTRHGPMYGGWMMTTGHPGWRVAELTKGWGGDAEANCAVIRQCKAFVGIDSGPSKCASSTDTPTLVVWTGHHPAPFHDPAPNTTHLVPIGYHGLEPVCGDLGVIRWFEDHYNVLHYRPDFGPVESIKHWLEEVLR